MLKGTSRDRALRAPFVAREVSRELSAREALNKRKKPASSRRQQCGGGGARRDYFLTRLLEMLHESRASVENTDKRLV